MIETVKTINGHSITRTVGTKGHYEVILEQTEHYTKYIRFSTIKAAVEYIEKNL